MICASQSFPHSQTVSDVVPRFVDVVPSFMDMVPSVTDMVPGNVDIVPSRSAATNCPHRSDQVIESVSMHEKSY